MEKVNWQACSRVCCKYFWWKRDAGHHGSPQFCHLCMQTQERLCMAWALYSTLVSQPMVLVAPVPSVPTSFHFVLRTGRTHLQARRNIQTLYIFPGAQIRPRSCGRTEWRVQHHCPEFKKEDCFCVSVLWETLFYLTISWDRILRNLLFTTGMS